MAATFRIPILGVAFFLVHARVRNHICGGAEDARRTSPCDHERGDADPERLDPSLRGAPGDATRRGSGTFLQRISFDEQPVFRDHHFVGFRITELKGPGWEGSELRPGDVVTAVNGFSIERPEQAQQAFLSLAVASELRVDYERDAQPRTLRLTIVDDP